MPRQAKNLERYVRFLQLEYRVGDTIRTGPSIVVPTGLHGPSIGALISDLASINLLVRRGKGVYEITEELLKLPGEIIYKMWSQSCAVRRKLNRSAETTKQTPQETGVTATALEASEQKSVNDEVYFVSRADAEALEYSLAKLRKDYEDIETLYTLINDECAKQKKDIDALRELIATLEKRIGTIRTAKAKELVSEFPQIAKLLQQATDNEAAVTAPELPGVNFWQGECPINYRNSFRKVFGTLTANEQRQTVKAIRNLAKYGPAYPALDTKKLEQATPDTPPGSRISRASKERRFTWQRNGESLTVFNLMRHSEAYASEA